MSHPDTGLRRRATDRPPAITDLVDEATVQGITEQAWLALVGEDEVLVPLPAPLPAETRSSWVEIVGPWTGSVVLTCGRETALALTRALLREHASEVLEEEDVDDALGELANVVGGNVKAVLPGPSVLGLPETGTTPPPGREADTCRVHVLWRGEPLTVSVQSHAERENEVPL
ncbi:chemotaxis phosphatase CheX-like protein [Geodermatophilus normandii]|uniref:Chemotaxis phosphatase CheX-like protein n=1 Tax=Geodermatophilus normandii TaxID=1137989 RepID=A0A317QHG6_9ACTN|nr:chemotaxis protein CheX [Geodermatophilus normandii]PWW22264.1 chemotaxis phosphatase CheX-like protein [Geodermatophilus normandii]